MKKSLLALAVLGAFASAAQAQTSVTLYGILDAGLNYTNAQNAANDSVLRYTANEISSRWGIRGSEDLGGGLSVTFGLENGFNLGSGVMNGAPAAPGSGASNPQAAGKLFDRGANVGLRGSWGHVQLGRIGFSPFIDSQLAIDTNSFSNFASLNNLAFVFGSNISGANQATMMYWVDNALKYTSPNMSGFTVSGLYGLGQAAGNTTRNRTVSLGATYVNGPLAIGAGYYDSKNAAALYAGVAGNGSALASVAQTALATQLATVTAADDSVVRASQIGVKYNFGQFALGLNYSNYKNPSLSTTYNTDYWNLGGTYSITPTLLLTGNYIRRQDKNLSSNNGNLYKVGVKYTLSKTVFAYADLGRATNSATGQWGVLIGQATGVAGQSQTALAAGLVKFF
jgi:predicted porin